MLCLLNMCFSSGSTQSVSIHIKPHWHWIQLQVSRQCAVFSFTFSFYGQPKDQPLLQLYTMLPLQSLLFDINVRHDILANVHMYVAVATTFSRLWLSPIALLQCRTLKSFSQNTKLSKTLKLLRLKFDIGKKLLSIEVGQLRKRW